MALQHPNIDPIAIHFTQTWGIHWYGITYVLAFITAYALLTLRSKRNANWNDQQIGDLVFYGALGVMLGGRIGYVLFYEFNQFLANPLWLIKFWDGGMSFHGGFLGVMIAMALYAKATKRSAAAIWDFVVPAVPLGLMFGRIGNFINGELYGRVVADPNYPLAMLFQKDLTHALRHPSQLYQASCEGLLLFVVLWIFSAKPRPRWAVSGLFLMGYGVARFSMEFFREPDIDQGFILLGWMTKGQILTLPMIVAGILMMLYAYRTRVYDWGPAAVATLTPHRDNT